jgi:4-amino-4-deoxy-L-arabinose transferase-like glycosyltransferase
MPSQPLGAFVMAWAAGRFQAKSNFWLRLPVVLLVAAGLRLGLLVAGVVPFNADEAVVGLMARHILQGERPVFFYGQAYLGSLDAWLVAGAFVLLGQTAWAIRLVQIVLYLGTVATTYALGLKIYHSHWIAGTAALLLAAPPVLFTLYSTISLGGYGETLLIGNVLLLLALWLLNADASPTHGSGPSVLWRSFGWFVLGLLAGLGFWSFPLILVYLLPILIVAAAVNRHRIMLLTGFGLLLAAGFGVGALPWWAYTLTHGGITVLETGGQFIAGASSPNLLLAATQHLFNFLLFGLTAVWGLRPPWNAVFLALGLAPFAIALNSAAILFAARRTAQRHDSATIGRWLLAGTALAVVTAFIITPFGADPSGRYFLPLAAPLALYIAEMLHWLRLRRRQRRSPGRKWFGQSLALGLIAFNWWGNIQSAAAFPPGLTTQFDAATQIDQRALPSLADFLRAQGETRGYSTYWVEYPLAFISRDDLIFVARLPYHPDLRYSARDDRYAPYDDLVSASPRVAYITARLPELDSRLRSALGQLAVTYQMAVIGDFHVYFHLSRKVTPDELGL